MGAVGKCHGADAGDLVDEFAARVDVLDKDSDGKVILGVKHNRWWDGVCTT